MMWLFATDMTSNPASAPMLRGVESTQPQELVLRSSVSEYGPSQLPNTTSAASRSRTKRSAVSGAGRSTRTSPTAASLIAGSMAERMPYRRSFGGSSRRVALYDPQPFVHRYPPQRVHYG